MEVTGYLRGHGFPVGGGGYVRGHGSLDGGRVAR